MWYNKHSDHMQQMHPQPVGNYANPATKRIVPDRDDLLVMSREGVESLLAEIRRLRAEAERLQSALNMLFEKYERARAALEGKRHLTPEEQKLMHEALCRSSAALEGKR